eukprot:gene3349-13380_t
MQAPARVPADPVAPEFALHKRLLSGGHRGPRDGNHPDIPVLGADFLTMMGAVLTVNYKLSTVSLCHAD